MRVSPTRPVFNFSTGNFDMVLQDPAQIVTVATSGAMFTSIQDAINSITDAASNKQYVIHIAPGTYTGNLTLKPFVHLVGEGNGPAAPLVVGKITAIDYLANQYTLINRLGQSYTVASDGETCNNWYSPVIVNDFFATFSTDKNYSFLGIYQSCAGLSSVSTVMVNCQILCSSTYDGSTKGIVALHQTGDGFGAGVSNMTVQISSKNSSGELACRRISVSGAAEYNSALCNMKISNVKAASTATACATIVSSASTGYRISANDQVRISGNLVSASAQCMNTGGNSGTFFSVGASVYIDPAITGYAANTAVGDTQYVWLNSTSANYPTTGAGLAIVTPYTLVQSGFVEWSSVGATYWSYTPGTRAFTLDKRFTGLVKSSPVVAPAAQTLSGGSALTNFAANYLYVDSTGALKSTLTKNEALFEDNIPFGILYSDGTNYLFKKENHPAKFPTAVSGYLHETSGNLLANNGGGNLTTLVAASRTIKMVGASTLKDHGLNTTLPDSSGAALSFTSVYTGASGMAIDGTGLTAIPSKWQNTATTVTNAANNERIVVRIGVLMDNLNSSAPQYVFVYHNAVYGNSTAAQNAINGGNITAFPQALIDLEVIQLGFACVTANGSGGGTLDTAVGTNGIVISKQVANANLLSGAASNVAGNIINDVTNFGVILSSADTSAQLAFDTIDNTAAKKATSSVDNAIVRFDGATGQLLQSNYTLNKEPIITDGGIIQVNNDTDATSTTDGSLQTDGGLSVVKSAFIGATATAVTSVVTPLVKAYDANGIKFQENGGTEVGSYTDAGAWTLGPTAGISSYHTVYGTPVFRRVVSGGQEINGEIAAAGNFQIYANGYYDQSAAKRKALTTGTGATRLIVSAVSGANAFDIFANNTDAQTAGNDWVTTNEKSIGSATQAGAWTFPVSVTTPTLSITSTSILTTTSEWGREQILYGNTATTRNGFLFKRAKGTVGSPAGVVSGDTLGTVGFGGRDSSGNFSSGYNGGVEIIASATETWSSSARGASLAFWTSANGSAAVTNVGGFSNAGAWTLGPSGSANRNLTVNGSATITKQYNVIGSNNGNYISPTRDNTNIVLYDISSTSWNGIGASSGGQMYFVTGLTSPQTVGVIGTDGSWTLGPSSGLTTKHLLRSGTTGGVVVTEFQNYHSTSPYGISITYSAASPNGTGNEFMFCSDSTTTRMTLRSNGGLVNYQANDANLSDRRLKVDIVDAPSQLEFIKALRVCQFAYRDSPSARTTGLIAQDVEALDPDLVQDAGPAKDENGEEFIAKAIRTSDIEHRLIKAVQELAAKNEQLESTLASVLARLEALEGR